MKLIKILLVVSFLFFGIPYNSNAQPSRIVRVAVVTDASQFRLTVRSSFKVLALKTNQELYKGSGLWNAGVVPAETGVRINDLDFKVYGIRIQPAKSPSIYINGRKFRGAVDIIRQSNKTLLAINHLDVEEYVCGVLYHEVAPWWPLEALKAQAIVSRTFALYQAKVNARKDYDLVSTVYSQVYGGRTSERGRTSKAVRRTRGQVLLYQNKVLPAFYHATCGGHTENSANLWKINLPPLRGRKCQFCRRSPHFRWKRSVALKDIEEALKKAGFKVGLIETIKILDRDVSGRITDLEIVSDAGTVKLSANRFRLAIGANLIKSTNFNLETAKRKAVFEGFGWGHGVGMCQWGAFFMSRKGFTAAQILGYYYPESKIAAVGEEYETF